MLTPSASAPLITALLALLTHVSGDGGGRDIQTGHDFDFNATYPPGLQISTKNPPSAVLPADEILVLRPQITVDNPAGNDESRYIAFLEAIVVPDIPSVSMITSFSWILTNLTILENGTLSDAAPDVRRLLRFAEHDTSEVRNATVQVWQQSSALEKWVNGNMDDSGILYGVSMVWANATDDDAGRDVLRAGVDFKVRNETGADRGDVDGNGNRITSASSVMSTTAAPTSGVESPTATPNAASPRLGLGSCFMAAPGYLIFSGAL
ncbi:hypothetical protein F4805DRAFT_440828 [Annulohypoxylon moriforme]|nr:hypothetical protein F4805DRAFT_440828 [Annulohypoxylon moriforme]